MVLKQYLIMRTDLKMRRGKEIAQAAHASLKLVLENMTNKYVEEWLNSAFTKIAVGVDSEEELLSIYERAKLVGIPVALITDNGATEFGGVKTNTCIALGPGDPELVSILTNGLKLR